MELEKILDYIMVAVKTNKWIIKIIPEFSAKAHMTTLKSSYFGHIIKKHNPLKVYIVRRNGRKKEDNWQQGEWVRL